MSGYKLNWVTSEIAVGAAPYSRAALETIERAGVEVILNLCLECGELHEIERAAGFLVYWLPVSDAYIPELNELDDALEWLDSQLTAGKKALVHCRFGVGRTGTIIGAYLLKKGESLDLVIKKMKTMPAAPTNRDQRKLLFRYAEKLSKNSPTGSHG